MCRWRKTVTLGRYPYLYLGISLVRHLVLFRFFIRVHTVHNEHGMKQAQDDKSFMDETDSQCLQSSSSSVRVEQVWWRSEPSGASEYGEYSSSFLPQGHTSTVRLLFG